MKKTGIFLTLILSTLFTQLTLAQTSPLEVRVSSFTDTLNGSVGEMDRDVMGNLFVADFANKVWKISASGKVTVWSDRMYGSSGNTLDAQGNLYQANYYGSTIVKINRYTEEVTEVAHEGLVGPVGLTFMNRELYVCNCNNNTIARVAKDGTVTTVASSNLFNCPNGITAGRDGSLYVVNFRNPNVVKVDTSGNATLFAELPASSGGHIIEQKGNFYVTSFFGHQIFKVSAGGQVTHFAGTGTPGIINGEGGQAQFSFPNGIVAANGALYVNDLLGRGTANPQAVVRKIAFPDFSATLLNAMQNGGLAAAEKVYKEYKNNPLFVHDHTEAEMNLLAYGAMNRGQQDIAIGLFKLNAESYPQSFNVWDSLAEGYMVKGDKKNARKYYKKSLELNPQNSNATAKLKELGD